MAERDRDALDASATLDPVATLESLNLHLALPETRVSRALDAVVRDRFEGRLRLLYADAARLLADPDALAAEAGIPDVVLVDPMHPPRRKSALPKLEMRLFRALLGEDPDQAELLAAALDSGATRIVVKRPVGEPPMTPAGRHADLEPNHAVKGRTTRFDVYLRPGNG